MNALMRKIMPCFAAVGILVDVGLCKATPAGVVKAVSAESCSSVRFSGRHCCKAAWS